MKVAKKLAKGGDYIMKLHTRVLTIVGASVLVVGLAAYLKGGINTGTPDLSNSFTAGTYKGTAEGHNGKISVEVTVTADAISEIKVLSHNETEYISDPAIEKIPQAIIEKQSTAVDAIASATVTSNGIMNAVEDALNQARGNGGGTALNLTPGTYTGTADGHNDKIKVEVVVTDAGISEIKILSHSETEYISDPAIEKIPQAIIEKQSVEVDAIASATVTSNGIMAAVKDALSQDGGTDGGSVSLNLTPGTYTGTADGHNGKVKVEVIVTEAGISEVKVLSHDETEYISDPAIEKIPLAIVEKQSVEVDAIASATVTSKAIMAAVKDALSGSDAEGGDEGSAEKTPLTLTPGTFEGTAKGHNGDIKVTVTVGDTGITDIKASHEETEYIGDVAIEKITASIIESQSLEIDAISNATVTSKAFLEAVGNALGTDK